MSRKKKGDEALRKVVAEIWGESLIINEHNIEKFMLESNTIEGESRINPGDIEAVESALPNNIMMIEDILEIHSILGEYLKEDWVGRFREVNIRVGDNTDFPEAKKVPPLMEAYMFNFDKMDSWEAHNRFEKIHPFRDLNGRMGRIIWLMKALKEGYRFGIPFLQMYYYQTLERYKI